VHHPEAVDRRTTGAQSEAKLFSKKWRRHFFDTQKLAQLDAAPAFVLL
jgi:hypothetical protein